MSRKLNYYFGDEPGRARRINEVWEWVIAFDAFDYGDRDSLAKLTASSNVPDELRPALADIVAGRRKPKTMARTKIPPSERMRIAMYVSLLIGLIDELSQSTVAMGEYTGLTGLQMVADIEGVEPIHVRRSMDKERRDLIADTATDLGVSKEAIKGLLRVMRKKLRDYPKV